MYNVKTKKMVVILYLCCTQNDPLVSYHPSSTHPPDRTLILHIVLCILCTSLNHYPCCFLANYTVVLRQLLLLTCCQFVLNYEDVYTIQNHSNIQIDVKTSNCTLLYVGPKQTSRRRMFVLSPTLDFYERKL